MQSPKKLVQKWLAWENSGVVSLLLFAIAFSCWGFGLVAIRYKPFFLVAALLLLFGFAGLAGWCWNRDIFWRYDERYSPRNRLAAPERKRTGSLWFAMAFVALAFLAVGAKLWDSYQTHAEKLGQGTVDIFLADTVRTKARKVPSLGGSDERALTFALASVPRKEVVITDLSQPIKMDVVVRNSSGVSIRNVHVTIESDGPIKAGGAGLVTFSDTELRVFLAEMRPYKGSKEEHLFPVEIHVPRYKPSVGILVTVEGDNLPTVAGAVQLTLVRHLLVQPPPEPDTPPVQPLQEPVFK